MSQGDLKTLRAQVLARRRSLSAVEIETLSRSAILRFERSAAGLGLWDWRGKQVALYRGMAGEPDLRPLEEILRARGAWLCFPRIASDQLIEMAGAPAPDPSVAFVSGAFGIDEPPAHSPVVPPQALDAIFVPGVAFGLQGQRVGMGKGYYDRYLELAPQAARFALAFDFQVFAELHQNPWDQPVHRIWTESREISPGRTTDK